MSEPFGRMNGHRWSGWPGAYCFYCMADDPVEACVGQAPGHEKCDIEKPCVGPPCAATPNRKEAVDRQMNPEAFK